MKTVIATIIGFALLIALYVGVIVPIAEKADDTGKKAEQRIETIQKKIDILGDNSSSS